MYFVFMDSSEIRALLAKAETIEERVQGIKIAVEQQIPLHKIEEYLDQLGINPPDQPSNSGSET